MASRSSSRSEGEVLSSDSDAKANKSLSFKHDSKVDRPNRHDSLPRAPTHRSHRSRSRSPYRAPRGEKRHREDDSVRSHHRNDPRNFAIRYEDERSSHRSRSSYDHRSSKRSRTYSRSRSGSRSPFRHTKADDLEAVHKPVLKEAIANKSDNRSKRRDTKPEVSENIRKDRVDPSSRQDRNVSDKKEERRDKEDVQDLQNSKSVSAGVAEPKSTTRAYETGVSKAPEDNGVLDEAALIEERRKRREAIKNKYRGQAPSLLVQALQLGTDSNQSTPGQNSLRTSPARSVSPTASTPRTPQPQSPEGLRSIKEDDFSNSDVGSPAEDEPSAADYDPTVDMEEERARHDKRLFKEDEDSLERADDQVLNQSSEGNVETKPAKAEFDMFADEDADDDDMFAEAPGKSKSNLHSAQALDVTMMDNWDDPEGYYITIIGELIENRYHVKQTLGRGMFSSVVRAEDDETKQTVAIKIVRNNESMRKAGIKEIDILKDIATNDPEDRKHVIRLQRSFDHKGHLCMVFENLSLNLREVLKKFGRDVGISVKAIRSYAQQLFLGLSLLKKCQYLHADLKPDNILVNEGRNLLKICDLGSASPITENATAPYLVSRFYRAPEVILGIPYDYGIDMWSVGCTLFELHTGKILFTGRNNNNMLRAIMECRGKFPHKLLRRGLLTYDYFDDLLNFRSQETDRATGRVVTKIIDIKAKPVRDLRSRLFPKGKRMDEEERKEVELLVDLLDKCLDLRPDKRITPTEALKHPFITKIRA